MKDILTIDEEVFVRLLAENPSDDYVYDDTKICIDGLIYYRRSFILRMPVSSKSTANSLIKREADFDYQFCDDMYEIIERHGIYEIKYARETREKSKDTLSYHYQLLSYHYQLDLYSAYPHILKYEKLPVNGNLYEEESQDRLNFYRYTGKVLKNNCIITNDLKDYVEKNNLGECEYLFSTDYKVGSKMGDKLIEMVYKNKRTKKEAKDIHYGYYQKKYIKYDEENDCYVRNIKYNHEILMVAILSQLVYIMLNIKAIINDRSSCFITDAYLFDNLEDIDRVNREIKAMFPNYDYRIYDCHMKNEEDSHGTIIYKTYPDLPDAPRSHHKKCTKEEQ